jgi:hypothetical protein
MPARLIPMLRDSAIGPWLLALFCAVLLSSRAGGAHLHLCFDGSEPAVSFHAFEVDLHQDEPQAAAPHQDTDVGVLGEVLAKLLTLDLDLPPVLLATLIGLVLLRAPRERPQFTEPRSATAAALYLRPPLRGPPPFSSL